MPISLISILQLKLLQNTKKNKDGAVANRNNPLYKNIFSISAALNISQTTSKCTLRVLEIYLRSAHLLTVLCIQQCSASGMKIEKALIIHSQPQSLRPREPPVPDKVANLGELLSVMIIRLLQRADWVSSAFRC
jgi:hypothetical protein